MCNICPLETTRNAYSHQCLVSFRVVVKQARLSFWVLIKVAAGYCDTSKALCFTFTLYCSLNKCIYGVVGKH